MLNIYDVYQLTSMEDRRTQTAFRLPNELVKSIKILAIHEEKSLNDLAIEAFEDLLKKYKKRD